MCEVDRRAISYGYPVPRPNRCLVSHTAHPGGPGRRAACRHGAAAHGRPLLVPGRGSCTAAVCALREAFHVIGAAPRTLWALRAAETTGEDYLQIKQLCWNSGPCGFLVAEGGAGLADRAERAHTHKCDLDFWPGSVCTVPSQATFSAPRVRHQLTEALAVQSGCLCSSHGEGSGH